MTDPDIHQLETIHSYQILGGRPLGPLGVPTKGEARLIDRGWVILRGGKLYLTRAGREAMREGVE